MNRKITVKLIDEIESNFPAPEIWARACLSFRHESGLISICNAYNLHYQGYAALLYKAFDIIEYDSFIVDFDRDATHSQFKHLFQTLRHLIKLQAFI